MIEEFFIDNQLYLEFLGIKKTELPVKNQKIDLQELYKIVEKKFRSRARELHPDFGGNQKDFQFLLKSKQVIFDQQEKEKLIHLSFTENIEGYDKNKIASQLGEQIYDLISSWSQSLGIKAIKKPTKSVDDNEWLFNIIGAEKQLSLNVQLLSNELAELSKNSYADECLNVLVCLFVPSKKLISIKNQYNNSATLKFNDLILLETTSSKKLLEYFGSKDQLCKDLEEIKCNKFISKENEIKIKTSKEARSKDKEIFDQISNFKLFNVSYNETAADFIDKL